MIRVTQDTSRTDVKRLLEHTRVVLAKYTTLDVARSEPAVDTFGNAVAQIAMESARYEEPYRLAIIGEFKVGKSSLINAFLGQRNLVSEGVAPTTGAVTELRHAPVPKGIVLDAEGKAIFEGDPALAARYADQRTAEGKAYSAQGIRVILELSAKVLERLTIIDTPGLGASELDDRVTLDSLHMADAAILVMNAVKAGGDTPVAMAERLRSAAKRLTLVITRADLNSATAKANAAELAEVFRDVIDGPPIVFSSKKVQEALDLAAASAEARDETKAEQARAALVEWGHSELTDRIVNGHLSSSGTAGVARARAALGELRRRCKSLSLSSAREQDATATLVGSLTNALGETERIVAEVLDAKLPYLEDKIEDIVNQYVGKLLDDLRLAVELFIDDRMDLGLAEAAHALWAKVSDDYAVKRRKEIDRSFRKLFPPELATIAANDIERSVNRLMMAEWKSAVKDVGGTSVDAGVDIADLLKKVDEHLTTVLGAIAASITSFIFLIFIPGGWLAELFEFAASSVIAQGQIAKADARVGLVKRKAGIQIKNQRAMLRSQLSEKYRELNRKVHGSVVEKTRSQSNDQLVKRDAASAALVRWREAARDLSAVLEAVADIEQGGL